MASAKKRRSRAKPTSAAGKIRDALDPDPPSPTDNTVPPKERRSAVEEARPPPTLRLLPQREVCARVGVTAPTLWKWTRDGKFPTARVMNGGKLGYLAHEVEEWIRALPLQKLKPPDKKAKPAPARSPRSSLPSGSSEIAPTSSK
jgi:predicted DNA-binding transcriptional regulator AlpA